LELEQTGCKTKCMQIVLKFLALYANHKNLEILKLHNNAINAEADLPRYYKAFEELTI